MKLTHILYPAMFGCLFSLYSCVEDKGSYDHLPVNEITVTGTETTYSVLAGITELAIEPEVTGSILGKDDSQYEYTWYACKKALGSDDHTHTELGHEKNLKTTVILNPESYYLYLLTYDHSTDMEWVISGMTLQVSTSLTTGFYVLGEKEDGVIGMDFLSMPSSEGDTHDTRYLHQLRKAEGSQGPDVYRLPGQPEHTCQLMADYRNRILQTGKLHPGKDRVRYRSVVQ